MNDRHALAERLGRVAGLALAPWTAGISAARRGRMFHPEGIVARAIVEPVAAGPWPHLATALAGHALVRFSGALFRSRTLPDVLGCAIRFTDQPPRDERPRAGDQDLLLATIRRPWTMVLSPATTDVGDHLANHYFGVCPFRFADDVIEWKLVPDAPSPAAVDRDARLVAAMGRREARLTLAARRWPGTFTRGDQPPFAPVARLILLEPVAIDQEALRFDPYRSGRGIVPTGFIHGLRIAAYAASQWARPGAAHARG